MIKFRCPACSAPFVAKEATRIVPTAGAGWYHPSQHYVTACPSCGVPLRFQGLAAVLTVCMALVAVYFGALALIHMPRVVYLGAGLGIGVVATGLVLLFVRPVRK